MKLLNEEVDGTRKSDFEGEFAAINPGLAEETGMDGRVPAGQGPSVRRGRGLQEGREEASEWSGRGERRRPSPWVCAPWADAVEGGRREVEGDVGGKNKAGGEEAERVKGAVIGKKTET